ncbi:hypothetical protein [Burkholderia vietnamiensis]|uniref:hypothetical protein n=1 Tax=Burkholderia vietnamiensis TaxID=60552 RepID=UPI0012D93C62|nr:hypothetical protein [Burkholderia vietnamiensis]
MSIIEPSEANATFDRLMNGAYINTSVHNFQSAVIQIINSENNELKGMHAVSPAKPSRTVNISTPHGDVVLSSEHVLMAGDLVARLTFSSVRHELDESVTVTQLLQVIIRESTVVRVGDIAHIRKFGPNAVNDRIVEEIIVLMLSKLQGTLPEVK